jgi:fructokinase
MYDVVALGELLIDFTYYGVAESGGALFEQNPGGAPANVLALCAGFGLKTAFIGKVGADMHGDFLAETLKAKGIDTMGLIHDPDCFTTLAFVKLTEAERSFSFARKPGADTRLRASELNIEIINNAKVFHFGSLSLTDEPAAEATLAAVKAAKAKGVMCSYDPNYRAALWKDEETAIRQMRSVIGFADLIKISEEETILLTGESDPEKAAHSLLSQGAECVVVTLGGNGSIAVSNAGMVRKPAAPCKPLDTTGAGDTFWGSFLYCIINSGKPISGHGLNELGEYLVFANTAAAICTEGRGAIPSMPDLKDVYRRMK